MFISYSSKGHEIEGLDYNSEDDFIRWENENKSYHNLDVVYARIHLWPQKRDDGMWKFSLSFSVYGYYKDVLHIARVLYDNGIRVVLPEYDSLMGILCEDDYVGFTPSPDKYMNRDGVTNQVWFPSCDEVDFDTIGSLLKSTRWDPIVKVFPL